MEPSVEFLDLLHKVEQLGPQRLLTVPGRDIPPPAMAVRHEHPRLLAATAGRHRLELPDGQVVALEPGTALAFDRGAWHRILGRERRSYCSALIAPEGIRFFRRHHDGGDGAGDAKTWVAPPDHRIEQLAHLLLEADPEDHLILGRALLRLLRRALERQPTRGGAEATWERLLAYCEEEWRHGLGRETAATACGVDPAYVTALFHRFAGCSFQDWLTARRLREARTMLREHPDQSIAAVAAACGYADARYFRRMFKRRYGLPPSGVRAAG